MSRIAILGCGWLGFPLAKHLIQLGYHVNGSSTSLKKQKNLINAGINSSIIDLNNLNGDLSEFLNVDELIITIPPLLKNYIETIKKLIIQIESSTIKKVTYTSSISVYGNTTGLITEKTKTNPTRDSVIQITEIEKLLLSNIKFKTNIIRLGGLIGPNRHPAHHLSGKTIKAPNELINLIHLDDCIAVIEQLIKTDATNEIYNLVNPYHPLKGQYYSKCCEYLKLPPPVVIDNPNPLLKEISSRKICHLLNYVFKNNLILS